MERLIVDSKLLFSIGYNAKKGDLEIHLRDGTMYRYLGVPASAFLDFMNAESKEQYYTNKIKDQYVYRKLIG